MTTVRLESDARGIATVTLARPEKHNAMDAAMLAELTALAARLAGEHGLRAVVLTGEGASFCAGGDLGWMRAQFEADRAGRMGQARVLSDMLDAWNTLPVPVIGRVNGPAYGGGMGLLSICDVAVAVDTARFGFTETRLGLIPATIGPFVLARMGEGMARRVLFSSRLFGAPEAVQLGLLARAVAPEALDAAVEAETAPYLACSPEAVARAKRFARTLGAPITREIREASIAALADCWESDSAKAGIAAFFDKRPAPWTVNPG